MPRNKTLKTDAITPARDQAEAEALLLRIGTCQREVARITADMNDALAATKARFEAEAAPHNQEIQAAFARLHLWAEANRPKLLPGKGKTARIATGELVWRATPPRVAIRKEAEVIERLRAAGMAEFLRVKEAVDKEAILATPETRKRAASVAGITISQREEFSARPFESQIEVVEAAAVSKKQAA